MQIMHKTFAGTGTICLSVASRIPGTLVNQAAARPAKRGEKQPCASAIPRA
jgi:2-methylaconitate cis-trans-isomerase PrpF